MTYSVNEATLEEQNPSLLPPLQLLSLWWRRYTTRNQLRRALQEDPSRLYDDLGLSANALRQECRKWFWES